MSQRKPSKFPKKYQITNQPTNQGRPDINLCLCWVCRDSLSASALAGVVGYTQINPIPRGGRSIRRFARQRPVMRSSQCKTQRIEYPQCQFISNRTNHFEWGVTKP